MIFIVVNSDKRKPPPYVSIQSNVFVEINILTLETGSAFFLCKHRSIANATAHNKIQKKRYRNIKLNPPYPSAIGAECAVNRQSASIEKENQNTDHQKFPTMLMLFACFLGLFVFSFREKTQRQNHRKENHSQYVESVQFISHGISNQSVDHGNHQRSQICKDDQNR